MLRRKIPFRDQRLGGPFPKRSTLLFVFSAESSHTRSFGLQKGDFFPIFSSLLPRIDLFSWVLASSSLFSQNYKNRDLNK